MKANIDKGFRVGFVCHVIYLNFEEGRLTSGD